MQQVLFQIVLRILVDIKNLWQYKKLPCDKFVKKKEHFAKHFAKLFRSTLFN